MVQQPEENAAAAPAPMSLPLQTRLGEFEILEVIGEGGFSIVYLAHDHSLRRTVAIKEYLPGAIAYRNAEGVVQPRFPKYEGTFKTGLNSFLNEARILAQFEHPALIRIHRFWEQNGTAYMVMQYCKGRTLRQLRQDEPLLLMDESWLMQTMAPVLDALSLLHSRNCYHRDLSPDNILMLDSGAPMLLDFGAARQVIGDMTQALTVILKPGFAPIEQYADDESMRQGPWTDIYGVGAVLYFALTGKPPVASVARLVKDPLRQLSSMSELAISPTFAQAVDHALAVFPDARPASVAALVAELHGKAETEARAPVQPAPSQPAPVPDAPAPDAPAPGIAVPDTVVPEAVAPAREGAAPLAPRPPQASLSLLEDLPTVAETADLSAQAQPGTGPMVVPAEPSATPLPNVSAQQPSFAQTAPSPAPVLTVPPPAQPPAPAQPATGANPSGRGVQAWVYGVGGLTVLALGAAMAWVAMGAGDRAPAAPPAGTQSPVPPAVAAAPAPVPMPEAPVLQEPPPAMPDPGGAAVPDASLAEARVRALEDERLKAEEKARAEEKAKQEEKARAEKKALQESGVASANPALVPGGAAHSPDATVQPAAQESAGAPKDTRTKSVEGQGPGAFLQLSIRPWGRVIVDGKDLGVSPPLTRVWLPSGVHHVVVENDEFSKYDREVTIGDKKNVSISHRFDAR